METPVAQADQHMEVSKDARGKEMASPNPELREHFLDQSLFDIARQAGNVVDLLLKEHGLRCCVRGAQALRYYGAGRICSVRSSFGFFIVAI
jgi:hypothetical protein